MVEAILTNRGIIAYLIAFHWLAALLGLPGAATANEKKAHLLQLLYIQSGMETQVAQMPNAILTGFDEALEMHDRLKKLPDQTVRAYRESLEKIFSPEAIKKGLLAEWCEKLSLQNLEATLAWFNSTTGQQFTRFEDAAMTAEGLADMQRYEAQQIKSQPSPARVALFRKMDSLLKTSDSAVDVAMKIQLVVLIALVSPLPQGKRPDTEALSASLQKNRAVFQSGFEKETLAFFTYAYRKMSLDDLEKYVAFAASPAGSSLYAAAASGLSNALMEGCRKWNAKLLDP